MKLGIFVAGFVAGVFVSLVLSALGEIVGDLGTDYE